MFIADDHRLIADAYERLLGDDYTIVGKVADGRELLARAAELQPDIIVLDVSMPRLSGLEAAVGLREVAAAARIVPKREGRRLTSRQREVLQLLAEGKLMKQVALELSLSTRTVAHHKYKLMREQGIESNAELIQLAIEEGLIAPPVSH